MVFASDYLQHDDAQEGPRTLSSRSRVVLIGSASWQEADILERKGKRKQE